MLKKTLATILTITTLLSLGACSFIESNITESIETETEVVTTVDTTVNTTIDNTEVESSSESQDPCIPIQLSGIYNGSEVTMTLTLTEYNDSGCQFRHSCFVNGYASFCYHGKNGEENVCQARGLIDKTGRIVLEPIYDVVGAVSPEGKTVVYLADNEADRGKFSGNAKPYVIDLKNNTISEVTESSTDKYRLAEEYIDKHKHDPDYSIEKTVKDFSEDFTIIDKNGKECYTFKDAFSVYFISDEIIQCRQDGLCALYDVYGNRLSPEVNHIGIFEDGLAAFVVDGKLGLISDKGEIVIHSEIEVDDSFVAAYPPTLWLNEGLMLVNIDGTLGIVEVVRQK